MATESDHYHRQPRPIVSLQNTDEYVHEDCALGADVDGTATVNRVRYEFDPSGDATMRTIAGHGLGVYVPAKAIILDGLNDVTTTFTSATDAATIAISVEGANDIVAAIAISNGANPWDAGRHDVIPVGTAATSVKVTGAVHKEVTATVAVEVLTAGKLIGWLRYVVSE